MALDHNHLPILYPALAILFREIFVAGLREYLGIMGISLPVTGIAKVKTTIQFIAIGMVMLYPFFEHWDYAFIVCMGTFYFAAVLTLYSGIDYFVKTLRYV